MSSRASKTGNSSRLKIYTLRWLSMLLVLLLFNAAGLLWLRHEMLQLPEQRLRILSMSPDIAEWERLGEEAREAIDRFEIHFDQPASPLMLASMSQGDTPPIPFEIKPAVAGQWEWTQPDRLAYLLTEKLPAGRRFSIRPSEDAERVFGRKLVGELEQEFTTGELALEQCRVRSQTRRDATLVFTFNQKVLPDQLLKHLKIEVPGDKPHEMTADKFKALTAEAKKEVVVHCKALLSHAERLDARKIQVSVAAELCGKDAELGMKRDYKKTLAINAPFVHQSSYASSSADGSSWIRLRFSQDLSNKVSQPRVQVSPPVKQLSQRILWGDRIQLTGAFQAGRRYTLTLPGELMAKSGVTLETQKQLTVDVPDLDPSISFVNRNGILMPGGHKKIDLNLANVSRLRCRAWRLHENNLVPFLTQSRYSRDRAGTSRQIEEKIIPVSLEHNRPKRVTLDLAAILPDKTKFTGVYEIEVRASDRYWESDRAQVAVTDLALTSKAYMAGQKQMQSVWVTSLATGRPVAGVQLTGISRNNQILSEAITDENGLAQLKSPRQHPDGGVWVIAARNGDDFNYLRPVKRRDEADVDVSGRGMPATYEAMLYSERGLYRPGEEILLTSVIRDPLDLAQSLPRDQPHDQPRDQLRDQLRDLPLQLTMRRPDGRRIELAASQPSDLESDWQVDSKIKAQGMNHYRVALDPASPTGYYHFSLHLTGSKIALASRQVLVEQFTPARIRVDAGFAQRETSNMLAVEMDGQYLFGRPASGLDTRADGRLVWQRFTSKDYPAFQFGIRPEKLQWTLVAQTGLLNEAGKDELSWNLFESASYVESDAQSVRATIKQNQQEERKHQMTPAQAEGLWQIHLNTTVTETGGRSVSQRVKVKRDLRGLHLGASVASLSTSDITTRGVDSHGETVSGSHPVRLSAICLDAQSKPVTLDQCEWTLKRIEWRQVLEQVHGSRVWRTHERREKIASGAIALQAAPAQWTQSLKPGHYVLELNCSVVDAEAKTKTDADDDADDEAEPAKAITLRCRRAFEVTHSGVLGDSETAEAPNPMRVVMQSDQAKVAGGHAFDLEVTAPFAGRMLLTMESSGVHEAQVVDVKKGKQAIKMMVPGDVRGSLYVSSTLVRAINPKQSSWLPHRASGLLRLALDHQDRRLSVSLSAPKKVRSGDKVDISVDVGQSVDGAVHLWAVDEGLLLPTGYQMPDLHRWLYGRRSLEVMTSDSYYDLLPDFQRPVSMVNIGSDADKLEDGQVLAQLRRSSPVPIRHKRAAVLWQSAVPLENGRLEKSIVLPDFVGELRWMAVVVAGNQFGRSQSAMTLQKPVQFHVQMPNFLVPGDLCRVPVKLFNNTEKAMACQLKLDVSGPLKVQWEAAAHSGANITSVPANGHVLKWLSVRSDPALGVGEAAIHVQALEVRHHDQKHTSGQDQKEAELTAPTETPETPEVPETPDVLTHWQGHIAVRGVLPLAVRSQTHVLGGDGGDAASDTRLMVKADPDLNPAQMRIRLEVSPSPDTNLLPALERVLDYPYGCLEQTTSRLMALVHLPHLVHAQRDKTFASSVLASGIDRLWTMQNRSGGLGYWPGSESHDWGSAYAACFLAEARESGAQIPDALIGNLLKYLKKRVNSHQDDEGLDDVNTRAKMLYALSLHGQPDEPWMLRLNEQMDQLDLGGRAQLASAWLAAGRRDKAMKLISLAHIETMLNMPVSQGNRLTSSVHQQSLLLMTCLALLRSDPDHQALHDLTQKLATKLMLSQGGGHWDSTVNNSAVLLALSRYQLQQQASDADLPRANLRIKTATGKMVSIDYADQRSEVNHSLRKLAFDHSDLPLAIQMVDEEGQSLSSAKPWFLAIHQEGQLPLENVASVSKGLKLSASWRHVSSDASVLATEPFPQHVKVGDLVRVRVTLATQDLGTGPIDNIAIVAGIPAGFEIENPRLQTSALAGEDITLAKPDRAEFMSDRVLLFTSASKTPRSFAFTLRAMTDGQFLMPVIQASSMYDSQISAIFTPSDKAAKTDWPRIQVAVP